MEGAIKQRCSPSLSKHCTWLLAEQIPYCADVLFLLTLSQVGAQAGDVPFQGHRFASIQRWQPSCRSDFAMSFLLAVVQRNAPVYFFQLQKDLLSGEKTTIALRKEPEVQLWKKKKQLSKLHRIGCVGRKILLTQDDTAGAFWRCVLWSGNKESTTASCSCLLAADPGSVLPSTQQTRFQSVETVGISSVWSLHFVVTAEERSMGTQSRAFYK